jgi:ubiquinone/menaquinone biosynthesis C-methylase UbiE
MELTTNYKKHTSSNLIQRFLLARFNQRLVECVRVANPNNILDAGCGEGFTMTLLTEAGIQAAMTGIDFSDEAIAIARTTAPDLAISKASIYELPFKKSSFDLVICSEVLEHLENPDTAIAEITRVSKKYVLVSVPNEPYFQIANFLRGKYPRTFGNHPEHINHWSSDAIVSRLKKSGLSIVRVYRPFAWTLILSHK